MLRIRLVVYVTECVYIHICCFFSAPRPYITLSHKIAWPVCLAKLESNGKLAIWHFNFHQQWRTQPQRDTCTADTATRATRQRQRQPGRGNDIAIDDALLIQYKRNNIGFPFPHPLRSVVYSCQFTVDRVGYLRHFFSLRQHSRQYNSLSELLLERDGERRRGERGESQQLQDGKTI